MVETKRKKLWLAKLLDLLPALPLIWLYGNAITEQSPRLIVQAKQILSGTASPLIYMRFLALCAAAVFNLMLVCLLLLRPVPVHRSKRWLARSAAFFGTFIGASILGLPIAELGIAGQSLATALVFIGRAGSVFALAGLGKSFSILPEARGLVTGGAYAWARHPLYAAEIVAVAGSAIQFAQPWSALFALSVVGLLFIRSHFEEQVLHEAFPEYAAYRSRVRRFGFF